MWYNQFMEKKQNSTTRTAETVTISSAEYEKLQKSVSELKQQNEWLMEQLHLIKRKTFGFTSEKASDAVMEQLSFLFNEAEAYCAQKQEPQKTKVASHTRAKRSGSVKDIVPEDIETYTVEHDVSAEEKICPQCGENMQVIGKEVHRSLELIPAKARIREDVYYTYGCRNCDKNDISTPIVKAEKEPALVHGGFASPMAAAHIMTEKFVRYMPLYRQEQYWKSQNIMLSRQTMSNWLLYCSEHYLEPIYEELHSQLLQSQVLHADETTLQVLREPGKKAQSKSYMWMYRTSGDAKHGIVLYEYQSSRKQEHPRDFLDGFEGYLQTDGYSGYNAVKNVVHVGCWAHARRYFDEAVAVSKGSEAATGQAYCTQLFHLEEQFKDDSPDVRKQKRLEQEKPVLDALWSWANSVKRKAAPKSQLGKAIHYLLSNWEKLNNYLLDGRIELSNNRAERSIKPFVMGRKNWLFANTAGGAKSSAVIYSLIETAKENGCDPYRYLCWVMEQAPKLLQEDRWAEKLLPWMMIEKSEEK